MWHVWQKTSLLRKLILYSNCILLPPQPILLEITIKRSANAFTLQNLLEMPPITPTPGKGTFQRSVVSVFCSQARFSSRPLIQAISIQELSALGTLSLAELPRPLSPLQSSEEHQHCVAF